MILLIAGTSDSYQIIKALKKQKKKFNSYSHYRLWRKIN
jgi:precorrin-6x reductase